MKTRENYAIRIRMQFKDYRKKVYETLQIVREEL